MDFSELIQKVVIAAFATVGLIETIKNFIKTNKTWIYSLLMIPVAVGCYLICEFCPKAVIGAVLTIGITQECYQLLIQSVKKLIKNTVNKKESAEVE